MDRFYGYQTIDMLVLKWNYGNDNLDLSSEENLFVINKIFLFSLNGSRNHRMFKLKTTISGRLENSSGVRIRT